MDEEEINYKILRKIQNLESNSPILSAINPNFYSALSKYIKEMDDRLKNEKSSQKQLLLQEENKNINKIATSIYGLREKKILLVAISKIRGGDPNLKNLLEFENSLFDSVLNILKQTRNQIFKPLKVNVDNKEIEKNSKKDIHKNIADNNKNKVNKNPMVLIKETIPEFIGTDTKKYNLRKGDVISLPIDMCNTLIKRGVAKEIKPE